uniref:Uncharacterized protein AlNc14C2G369 n=1 Tax=Albugo laibachii Nc14 TaxID=890382 RepID=F0VZN1_9STRA|nr:conserved hypothetical protein [Albugo laibachii Nc14]|eukprot:CCA14261.1 conserved hypothetical protein [Albugo laibachii Nc14]
MTKHVFFMSKSLDKQPDLERFQADACEKPYLKLTSWPVDDAVDTKRRIVAINHQKLLHDVQRIGEKGIRSWFVGNGVVKDGRALLMTPMDPLFVLVSKLSASSNKSKSLNDLMASQRWWFELSDINEDSIESICNIDRSYLPDNYQVCDLYVKAEKDKIRQWLSRKVERLVDVLASVEDIDALEPCHDSAFGCTQENNRSNVTNSNILLPRRSATDSRHIKHTREAVHILEEYLKGDWFNELCLIYSIEVESFGSVDKSCTTSEQLLDIQRYNFRKRDALSEGKRSEVSKRQSSKKKSRLDEVNLSGSKSIKSFFMK